MAVMIQISVEKGQSIADQGLKVFCAMIKLKIHFLVPWFIFSLENMYEMRKVAPEFGFSFPCLYHLVFLQEVILRVWCVLYYKNVISCLGYYQ